jgi:hypothetical protein
MKGILGVYRGDFSAVSDLTTALRVSRDTVEALLTLSTTNYLAIQSNEAVKRLEAKLQLEVGTLAKIAAILSGEVKMVRSMVADAQNDSVGLLPFIVAASTTDHASMKDLINILRTSLEFSISSTAALTIWSVSKGMMSKFLEQLGKDVSLAPYLDTSSSVFNLMQLAASHVSQSSASSTILQLPWQGELFEQATRAFALLVGLQPQAMAFIASLALGSPLAVSQFLESFRWEHTHYIVLPPLPSSVDAKDSSAIAAAREKQVRSALRETAPYKPFKNLFNYPADMASIVAKLNATDTYYGHFKLLNKPVVTDKDGSIKKGVTFASFVEWVKKDEMSECSCKRCQLDAFLLECSEQRRSQIPALCKTCTSSTSTTTTSTANQNSAKSETSTARFWLVDLTNVCEKRNWFAHSELDSSTDDSKVTKNEEDDNEVQPQHAALIRFVMSFFNGFLWLRQDTSNTAAMLTALQGSLKQAIPACSRDDQLLQLISRTIALWLGDTDLYAAHARQVLALQAHLIQQSLKKTSNEKSSPVSSSAVPSSTSTDKKTSTTSTTPSTTTSETKETKDSKTEKESETAPTVGQIYASLDALLPMPLVQINKNALNSKDDLKGILDASGILQEVNFICRIAKAHPCCFHSADSLPALLRSDEATEVISQAIAVYALASHNPQLLTFTLEPYLKKLLQMGNSTTPIRTLVNFLLCDVDAIRDVAERVSMPGFLAPFFAIRKLNLRSSVALSSVEACLKRLGLGSQAAFVIQNMLLAASGDVLGLINLCPDDHRDLMICLYLLSVSPISDLPQTVLPQVMDAIEAGITKADESEKSDSDRLKYNRLLMPALRALVNAQVPQPDMILSTAEQGLLTSKTLSPDAEIARDQFGRVVDILRRILNLSRTIKTGQDRSHALQSLLLPFFSTLMPSWLALPTTLTNAIPLKDINKQLQQATSAINSVKNKATSAVNDAKSKVNSTVDSVSNQANSLIQDTKRQAESLISEGKRQANQQANVSAPNVTLPNVPVVNSSSAHITSTASVPNLPSINIPSPTNAINAMSAELNEKYLKLFTSDITNVIIGVVDRNIKDLAVALPKMVLFVEAEKLKIDSNLKSLIKQSVVLLIGLMSGQFSLSGLKTRAVSGLQSTKTAAMNAASSAMNAAKNAMNSAKASLSNATSALGSAVDSASSSISNAAASSIEAGQQAADNAKKNVSKVPKLLIELLMDNKMLRLDDNTTMKLQALLRLISTGDLMDPSTFEFIALFCPNEWSKQLVLGFLQLLSKSIKSNTSVLQMLMDAVLKSRKIIADFVISRLPNVELREVLRLVADAIFLISDLPENRDQLTFKEIRRVCLHLLATFLTSLMQRNLNNQSTDSAKKSEEKKEGGDAKPEDQKQPEAKPEAKADAKPEVKTETTPTESKTDSKEVKASEKTDEKETAVKVDEVKTGDPTAQLDAKPLQKLIPPNVVHLLGLLTGEFDQAFSSCMSWFLSKLSKDLEVDWKTNSKFLDLMTVREPESSKLLETCMKLMTETKKADRRAALQSLYQHLTTLPDEKPKYNSDMRLIESLLVNSSKPSELVKQVLSWLETLTVELSKQVAFFCSLHFYFLISPC